MNLAKIEENGFDRFSKAILTLGLASLSLFSSLIFQSSAGYFRFAIHNYFSVASVSVLSVINAFNIYEYVQACFLQKENFSILNF